MLELIVLLSMLQFMSSFMSIDRSVCLLVGRLVDLRGGGGPDQHKISYLSNDLHSQAAVALCMCLFVLPSHPIYVPLNLTCDGSLVPGFYR